MSILYKHSEKIFSKNGLDTDFFSNLVSDIEDGKDLLVSTNVLNAKYSDGVAVDGDIASILVLYQSLQERFESNDEICRINESIEKRPELIPTILRVQQEICYVLNKYIDEDRTRLRDIIAFGEIALYDDKKEVCIPSSRFLKIIIHNWGRYFSELNPNDSVRDVVKHALTRALEDELYFQRICIFRNNNDVIKLYGIVPKVCPARTVVGRLVSQYL